MKIFTSLLFAFLLTYPINSLPSYPQYGDEYDEDDYDGGESGMDYLPVTTEEYLTTTTEESTTTTQSTTTPTTEGSTITTNPTPKLNTIFIEILNTTTTSIPTTAPITTTTFVSTTTFVPTTSTVPLTTSASIPQISYEVEDLIEKVSTRFNELRITFLNNQKDVYDKVKVDLENYKILRDTSIKKFKEAYDQESAEVDERLKMLETKKSQIEKSIEKLHDGSWNQEENAKKLEELKERKKLLTDTKTQNCEDCDGFLDANQVNDELLETDNKIAELEEKIQNQEGASEIKRKRLNDEEARQLNIKYVELIHIYQKEVEERKKKEKLEHFNSIVNEKWMKYADKIGDLHIKVEDKMEKLTKNSLKVSKLTTNESAYSNDDDWGAFNINTNSFKWIPFDKDTSVPSDAVSGGEDADGSRLYIIRTKKDDSYLYGKYAVSYSRKDAYVTNSEAEIATSSFELLTSKNYTWCDSKTYQYQDSDPPICKTTHSYYGSSWDSYRKQVTIPGTFFKGGKCSVGFGYEIHSYTENVKVLGFGSCTASKNEYKFWF